MRPTWWCRRTTDVLGQQGAARVSTPLERIETFLTKANGRPYIVQRAAKRCPKKASGKSARRWDLSEERRGDA